MKDYEIKISQFVDNELSVNEQQELFRFLSEEGEARTERAPVAFTSVLLILCSRTALTLNLIQ